MISLCLIITGLSTGGAEIMLLKLLQHIDRSRFEIVVISLTSKGEIGQRIEAMGIPLHVLGMRPGLPNPFMFFQLFKLLRHLNPEVVHTWMYHADLIGGLAARLAGIRAVAWGIRHSNLTPGQNKKTTLMTMKVCAYLSKWLPLRILSCSERARDVHIAAGYCAKKFVLIPNGFDLQRFVPNTAARASVREELGLPSDALIIGLIARKDLQKNHFGFVEAASKVYQALHSVHFVLAGTGIDWDYDSLVSAIEHNGLRNNFCLLGRRDDIPRLMASLDILASSSSGEAFPNVLGEAMACGVPCVVTDVGDSAEIVGDTGRVVKSGDMSGLASQMVGLLRLPIERRLALGGRARERVKARFEIIDIAVRFQDFYERLSRMKE